jgi:hypothetical protein
MITVSVPNFLTVLKTSVFPRAPFGCKRVVLPLGESVPYAACVAINEDGLIERILSYVWRETGERAKPAQIEAEGYEVADEITLQEAWEALQA